jgi:hypothetical protein
MGDDNDKRIHPLEQVVTDEALTEFKQKLERLAGKDPIAAKLVEKLSMAYVEEP